VSELGIDALITRSEDEYVRANVRLAQDGSLRAALRETLRQRLRDSPLLDATGFVRNLESAYRGMWRGRFAPAP